MMKTPAEALQELINALLKQKQGKTETKLLDNADLRELLHVSDKTIYRMRIDGKIPFTRIGRKCYCPADFFKNLKFDFFNKS